MSISKADHERVADIILELHDIEERQTYGSNDLRNARKHLIELWNSAAWWFCVEERKANKRAAML